MKGAAGLVQEEEGQQGQQGQQDEVRNEVPLATEQAQEARVLREREEAERLRDLGQQQDLELSPDDYYTNGTQDHRSGRWY